MGTVGEGLHIDVFFNALDQKSSCPNVGTNKVLHCSIIVYQYPPTQGHAKRISARTGLDVSAQIYERLGFCEETSSVHPHSMLAGAAMPDIKLALEDIVTANGLSAEDSRCAILAVVLLLSMACV